VNPGIENDRHRIPFHAPKFSVLHHVSLNPEHDPTAVHGSVYIQTRFGPQGNS